MDRNIYVSVSPEFLDLLPSRVEKVVVEVVPVEAPAVCVEQTELTAEAAQLDEGQGEGDHVGKKRRSDDDKPKEKVTLKKRHQSTHPDKEDRLCSFVVRGEICPYSGECQYSHDVFAFLSKKPVDLEGPCIAFEKYGFCSNGLMCRFGGCHIDSATGVNMRRPAEQGGVIERQHINILKKTSQLLLRKKKFKELVAQPKALPPMPMPMPSSAASSDEGYNFTSYPDKTVKLVDFRNKVYVAPLTTVGNLPFRRVLKDFGADITCGEMAMATNILNGQASEWALLRRHEKEDIFGVQVAGPNPNILAELAQVLEHETQSDFVDLNCGCPIDVVCNRGSGSALMGNPKRLCDIVRSMAQHLPSRSITVKVRIGYDEKNPTTHKLIPQLQATAPGRLSAIMIHGRSKLQRYHKLANWEYVLQCARAQDLSIPTVPIIGNGDIFSFRDWQQHLHMISNYAPAPSSFVSSASGDMGEVDSELLGLCDCAMLGRGALIKPWLPTEIKEQRLVDISATQRLDMLKSFCNYGLEHWGSDEQGIGTTRRFLLEWLSYLHRYVPAGVLEHLSKDSAGSSNYLGTNPSSTFQGIQADTVYVQTMNQRPPPYHGRSDLETLLASGNAMDWIRISEMFLGPVKEDFHFLPKHKSNSFVPEATSSESSTGICNAGPSVELEDEQNNG